MDNAPRLVLIKYVSLTSVEASACFYCTSRKLYDTLFTSGNTLTNLRNAAISGRLFPGPTNSTSVAGRSLAWKVRSDENLPITHDLTSTSSF